MPRAERDTLAYLAGRASASAIGTACGLGPGEVRAHLSRLERLRHVVSRKDGFGAPPCRHFFVTAEGRRRVEA